MTPKAREVVFQLTGGGVALAIAVAGVCVGQELFGTLGTLALFVSVPAGVITGVLLIKLLHFAHRILVEES